MYSNCSVLVVCVLHVCLCSCVVCTECLCCTCMSVCLCCMYCVLGLYLYVCVLVLYVLRAGVECTACLCCMYCVLVLYVPVLCENGNFISMFPIPFPIHEGSAGNWTTDGCITYVHQSNHVASNIECSACTGGHLLHWCDTVLVWSGTSTCCSPADKVISHFVFSHMLTILKLICWSMFGKIMMHAIPFDMFLLCAPSGSSSNPFVH